MIKSILFLLLGWTAQLWGADQAQGLSYETAVPLHSLFYHEVPDAIDAWVKRHISDAEISPEGRITSYARTEKRGNREYLIAHVRLRTKASALVYFETTDLLSSDAKNVKELFFFPSYLEIVQKFDFAEACVLDSSASTSPDKSAFKKIPENIATQLRSTLLAENSYSWDLHSACGPIYVARLRLHRGQEVLDIDFCFHCHQMQIHTDKRSLPRRDFTSPVFRRLFSELFPGEKNFQDK